jgi:hypothetical protein
MRVVVEFTMGAREDLFTLLAARMPTEGDAARFGAEFLADIEQQLREHEDCRPVPRSSLTPMGLLGGGGM